MVAADQAIRLAIQKELDIGSRHFNDVQDVPRVLLYGGIVDEVNTAQMKHYLHSCGWPVSSVYGARSSHEAWLLIQHADRDHAFQREVLTLLEPLVPQGEVAPKDFAYLSDRIDVAEGRRQRYGTQFATNGSCVTGFLPMDDMAVVEQRRKDVGLPPLETYLSMARKGHAARCATPSQPEREVGVDPSSRAGAQPNPQFQPTPSDAAERKR